MVGPISALAKQTEDFQFHYKDRKEVAWSDLIIHDLMIMQRPFGNSALNVMQLCRDLGVKTWLDFDDNLIAVPESNPAHAVYSDPEIRNSILKICKMADVITASTRELASIFAVVNKNVKLIPNGTPDSIYWKHRDKDRRNVKMIFWRGTRTHNEDLMEYLDAMVSVSERYPDWKWVFVGEPYFAVKKALKGKAGFVSGIEMPAYFHYIASQHGEIGIVPLADHSFNRCKSNIAWQEFTTMGAATVAPGWEEWTLPGVSNYSSPSTFIDALASLIEDENLRLERAQVSRRELEKNWLLSKQNSLRLALLGELTGVQDHKLR